MKTDDRGTRQRNEPERDEATVVRLSDWLAPDDELVPFGPRAHARAAARQSAERHADPDSGAQPPAASGFWEGDTSVHTAVPGPGIFGEPSDRTADRRRYLHAAAAGRPALPPLRRFSWDSRVRERLADLADRISWRWAAAGAACVALALTVLVFTLSGSSPGHRETAAQAGIGDPARAALSGALDELGAATRAAAVADLQPLPAVDAAVGTIGAASQRAGELQVRHRRHAVLASVSHPTASSTGAVEPPTQTAAPTETEPTQATSTPTTTTGGGGSSSGTRPSSGSQKQPAFGAAGSLGPGSSPNG